MAGFSLRLSRLGRLALVVLIVAGAVLGMMQHRSALVAAQQGALRSGLFRMRDAIDRYQAERGACPTSLQALVDVGYLPAIPRDPFTNSTTTWRFEQKAGSCDVKSGTPQNARDGSNYKNW